MDSAWAEGHLGDLVACRHLLPLASPTPQWQLETTGPERREFLRLSFLMYKMGRV